jgi:hypothetical protein
MTAVHPALVALADAMDAPEDIAVDAHGHPWPCERCPDCGGAMVPPGLAGRLAHLMTEHGWRMDGRQYGNRNELLNDLTQGGA